MEIRISVVIPTYKRPELLAKCLSALSTQTLNLQEFEVVVVGDGADQYTEESDRQELVALNLPVIAGKYVCIHPTSRGS